MPSTVPSRPAPELRLKLTLRGAVQGVGFRPFVHRLATGLGLTGWVNNSAQGLFLEVEGTRDRLERFLRRLEAEKPPHSFIQCLESSWLDPVGHVGFTIRASDPDGAKTALVLPDIATCPECRSEIFDPANRRYHYPFTNCTQCGPRFSIIEALPYDRPNTAMKAFKLCPACQAEYDNPHDRRFHAQPNACPQCGPHLELWDGEGNLLVNGREQSVANGLQAAGMPPVGTAGSDAALEAAAESIRQGGIVAVKGLGGFHLMVAAHDASAIARLRQRKQREEKPFALMFPSLAQVQSVCAVSALEERLLLSPEAPIVLLRRLPVARPSAGILPSPDTGIPIPRPADGVAPENPYLGIMLPYTPLHHLLLAKLGFPVVATSGNLSDEPICIEEQEARVRLRGIADHFLIHNRPIVRAVDDSMVRVVLDRELVLRRARGFAPLPISLSPGHAPPPSRDRSAAVLLAVGAHLKNTVALAVGPQVFVSQHLGDLETELSFDAFRRTIADLQRMYEARPDVVVVDRHPDYPSTRHGQSLVSAANHRQLRAVQHHLAHVYSCVAENEVEPPVLGVAWDGTGYGLDGTVWGGEFFRVTRHAADRVAHFSPFRLPGGDQAVKEPRRSALGLLYAHRGDAAFELTSLPPLQAFTPAERTALKTMLAQGLNAPLTSSVGRLFDAVAAILGLRQHVRFEGQAAMELEFIQAGLDPGPSYPFALRQSLRPGDAAPWLVDWSPLLAALLEDADRQTAPALMAARFHHALADAVVGVAQRIGEPRVVLTGGCFQNRSLLELTVPRLRAAGFHAYWHQRIPPNDGGIALGQVLAARWNKG